MPRQPWTEERRKAQGERSKKLWEKRRELNAKYGMPLRTPITKAAKRKMKMKWSEERRERHSRRMKEIWAERSKR